MLALQGFPQEGNPVATCSRATCVHGHLATDAVYGDVVDPAYLTSSCRGDVAHVCAGEGQTCIWPSYLCT